MHAEHLALAHAVDGFKIGADWFRGWLHGWFLNNIRICRTDLMVVKNPGITNSPKP